MKGKKKPKWAPDLSTRSVATNRSPVWVAVSGGFDPLHVGHVRMFKEARNLGDKLMVIINNDNWLQHKKGFVFMPQRERAEIVKELPFVDKVVFTDHGIKDPDRSITRSLKKFKPAIFANGGDRKGVKDIPEVAICEELGIKMVFNVGEGGKVQSSSWMVGASRRPAAQTIRPWGRFFGWDSGKGWYLKTIYIAAGKRLSLQFHHHRSEYWMLVEGDATATIQKTGERPQRVALKKGQVIHVDTKVVHRLESKRGGVVVEIAVGNFDENDIVRIEDDHGRAPGVLLK